MALIEQIKFMKQNGMSDSQIITALKEQGNSPLEINEALSQFKIKSAITEVSTEEMQPSIMQMPESAAAAPAYPPAVAPVAPPAVTAIPSYSQQYTAEATQTQQAQTYPAPAAAYPAEAYQQYTQYPTEQYYAPAVDIATIRDISKQEIDIALKDIRKELESLSRLKADLTSQIQIIDSRLKKVEAIMQELQISIIRRIGEYGEAISGISEEIKATQDSFSKVIGPLLDKQRGITKEEISEEAEETSEEKPRSKKRDKEARSFEAYLER